jgi:hypothetical protein
MLRSIVKCKRVSNFGSSFFPLYPKYFVLLFQPYFNFDVGDLHSRVRFSFFF